MRIVEHEIRRRKSDSPLIWREYFPPFTTELNEQLEERGIQLGDDLEEYFRTALDDAENSVARPVVDAMRKLIPCSLLEADAEWHLRFEGQEHWALGIPRFDGDIVEEVCDDLELECPSFTAFYEHFGNQLEVVTASGGFVPLNELCFLDELFDIDGEELGIDDDGYFIVFFRIPNGDVVCLDNERHQVHTWNHEIPAIQPNGVDFQQFLESIYSG